MEMIYIITWFRQMVSLIYHYKKIKYTGFLNRWPKLVHLCHWMESMLSFFKMDLPYTVSSRQHITQISGMWQTKLKKKLIQKRTSTKVFSKDPRNKRCSDIWTKRERDSNRGHWDVLTGHSYKPVSVLW